MYKQEVIKFFDEFKLPFIVPQIPNIIRYRDEFTEKIHTIENLHEQEVVYISANGSICELDFSEYSPEIRGFLLWCFSVSITNKISTTIVTYYSGIINHLDEEELSKVLMATPQTIKILWSSF